MPNLPRLVGLIVLVASSVAARADSENPARQAIVAVESVAFLKIGADIDPHQLAVRSRAIGRVGVVYIYVTVGAVVTPLTLL